MPFIILNIYQSSEQGEGGTPCLQLRCTMGSLQVLGMTQHIHTVFLRVICVLRYFLLEWLGFFFSFCLSWCLLVISHLILILFWKVDAPRPFSDSSFPTVEMKGSLLALLTIYNNITSSLSQILLLTDVLAWKNWLETLCPQGIIELSTDRQ